MGGGATTLGYLGGNTVSSKPERFTPSQVVEHAATRYAFYINQDADLVYRKSPNRGKSWGNEVVIHASQVYRVTVWFDRWTPGDSGTTVHIWEIDATSNDVIYFSLDVSTDTLGNGGAGIVVFGGVSASSGSTQLAGAKAVGGNLLCVFNLDGGTEVGSYRSTDAGATWASRADANEAAADFYLLFPGNEADNQDMWLVYWDVSANEISLKVYDDSANSWGETSISGSMVDAVQGDRYSQMAAAVRASDGHLLLAAWNASDAAAADMQTWDINGAASITAKTNVVTDADNCVLALITISPAGTVFCTYAGLSDGSQSVGTAATTAVGIYQKASTDGMATWGPERAVFDSYIAPVTALCAAQQSEGGWPLICWANTSLGGAGTGLFSAAWNDKAARVAGQIGV